MTLIERHLKEWDEAEQGIYDIDEIMASAESDFNKESMPVVYPRKTKNPLKDSGLKRYGD